MTALATMPTAPVDSPIVRPYDSTESLMRELLQLRGTTQPAPVQMLDALYVRGLGRLADALHARNERLLQTAC